MGIGKTGLIGLLTLSAATAQAQTADRTKWELRVTNTPILQEGDSITQAYPFALYSKRQPTDTLSPELIRSQELGSNRYGNLKIFDYGGVFGIPAIRVIHQNCTGTQPESPVIIDDFLNAALYTVENSKVTHAYLGAEKNNARNILRKCTFTTKIAE